MSRRRTEPRPKTITMRRGLQLPEEPHGEQRPVTRADCVGADRPCPWVSCKHHLYLDVKPSGSIVLNFPHLDIDEFGETCALDVAAQGGTTLEEIGGLMNLTRERVRQIEAKALFNARPEFDDEAPHRERTKRTRTKTKTPSSGALTGCQVDVLAIIRSVTMGSGEPPSIQDLVQRTGKSYASILWHVGQLRLKGVVEPGPTRHRGIRLVAA